MNSIFRSFRIKPLFVGLLIPGSLLAALLLTPVSQPSTASTKTCLHKQTPEYRILLPVATRAETTRFAVIGDYGIAGQPEADVATLVKSWSPEFIVTTGDNNYPEGAADTIAANIGQYYGDFIFPRPGGGTASSTVNRFFPALGNHDWDSISCIGQECTGPYFDYFELPNNERYYDFVWGPLHFYILNSVLFEPDGITSDSIQAAWLQDRLAASDSVWDIVVTHYPPYSSGAQHGSNEEPQWPYADWGADAVFSGHEHIYERLEIDGIPYFVNGLGGRYIYDIGDPAPGSQVRFNQDYGAMLVEASAKHITFKFFSRRGFLVDSYTMLKD
jgi:hypothetical protein